MAAPLVKPILCPILIGRSQYLSALRDCLGEAANGHGQVVLVAGEAGIGKSRLISEVSANAADQGFRAITGHCFEQDEALPYAPLLEIFRTLLRAPEGGRAVKTLLPYAPELIRLLPDVSNLFSDTPLTMEVAYEPGREKRLLAQVFTLLVSEIAERQPLFLFIEDLQWCDEASLDVLLYLARCIASHPILLVLTYRSDEAHGHLGHLLTQLDRERLAAEMRLRALSVAEVESMLRAIFGLTRPVQADQLNLVYGLSDGNPFFVEEMLRTLASGGQMLSPERLTERLPFDTLQAPRTVDEAVQRRVARLSPDARRLVALAAIAGRSFTFALLQMLTKQDEAPIVDNLKELIAAQLVVEISHEQFAFRHALTRQAVYAGLLARERQTLHRSIAEALEHTNDPPDDAQLGDLAYHFSKAGAWRQSLIYAQRAGERALALYAPRAALEHLMRALESAEHLPDAPPGALAALQRSCGQAYEILGDFESARVHYSEALHIARSSGDDNTAWSLLIDLGNLWAGRDYSEAGAFYRRATELARAREDNLQHAHSLNRWGNWRANTGRMEEGIAAHQEALILFEEQQDRPGQAATLDLMGMAYGLNADLPNAVRECSRAIELFRVLGDKGALSLCLATRLAYGSGCMADTTISALMTPDECAQDAHTAEHYAREMEWSAGQAYALLQIGRAETAFGAFGPGLAHIREALQIAGEIEHQQWMTAARYAIGRADLLLLASGRAILELESGLATARKLGSAVWMGLITADLVSAYRQHGEIVRAEQLLYEMYSPDVLRSGASLTLAQRELALQWARLSLQRGDPDAALEVVACLDEQARRSGSDQPIPELLLVQGEALMRLRRWDEAEHVLEEARRGALLRMNPSSLWRTQARLTRLHCMTKHMDLARQEAEAAQGAINRLAESIEEADIRDTFLQAALVDIPRAARVPHPRPVLPPPDMLTRREREVAKLIYQGKSNHEIADALVLSERTVTTHVTHILGKLGFSSRTQIVAWFVADGADKR